MSKKTKVLVVVLVFILQMVIHMELFVSTLYAATEETIAEDAFSSGNLSGGEGWSGSWASSGEVSIANNNANSPSYCLRLVSYNSSVTRKIDMRQWFNPTLTYYYKVNKVIPLVSGSLSVIIDDGTVRKTVKTHTHILSSSYGSISVDLSGYNMSENFKIEFVSSFYDSSSIYIDDVAVKGYKEDYGNSIADAGSIAVNSETAGEINYAGDQDYFKFTTGAAGLYTITTTGSTDTYGHLYSANGSQISENNDKDVSSYKNFYMMEKLLANTTYYVCVKNNSSSGVGQYVLKVDGPIDALFFEGFENWNHSSSGWISSSVTDSSSVKYNGAYSIQLKLSDTITKSLSTAGYENIRLSYARRSVNFESGDKLICQWSADGTTWYELESMSGTNNWGFRSYNLPSEASDNINFRIRFYTSGSSLLDFTTDYGYVDNVLVTGTKMAVPSMYYEAEEALLYGVGIANGHAGYTGTGFVDYINTTGDYIQWTVDIAQNGIYKLSFRYALEGTSRPLDIIINNKVATSSMAFPATGAWTTWKYVATDVLLEPGVNTIKALAIGSSGANLDHMKISLVQAITPTPIATPTPTPTAQTNLKVEFYNDQRSNLSNTIYPNYKITNQGSLAIDLSKVKLRYYYTKDGNQSQSFWCDWSTIGKTNVTGIFMEYVKPHTNSDCYLEIGFKSGAGSLAPGASIEVRSRIAKSDWTNYEQINDYSFRSNGDFYSEWNFVTAYIDNTLVWGIPPGELTPTPTPLPSSTSIVTPSPASGNLKVEFYNNSKNKQNTIYPYFKITNIGSTPIELSKVKLRYYYTPDSEVSQLYWCDKSTVGVNNVTGIFVNYEPAYINADCYLEIGFTSGAGNLASGASIEILSRITKTGWEDFIQTNDYSFDSLNSYYTLWNNVTAYIDNTLVWGIPPHIYYATPTPIPTPTVTPTATPTVKPTPTRTPGPSATIGIGNGLRGEYYDNIDFTQIKEIRIDSEVDFDWGEGSPNAHIGADTFSVIWIGKVQPLFSEEYTFYTVSDERIKLWVDNVLLIDNNIDHTVKEDYGTIELDAGLKYDIRIEYCEKSANAVAKLMWSSVSQEKGIIPRTQLYPPKMFNAQGHDIRTNDKSFAIGDYVPLLLQMQVLWDIKNPVISVDMNLRKPDGTSSEFVLKEIMSGTAINKNMFKVYVNGSIISTTGYSVWTEGTGTGRKLKIRVLREFTQNEVLQISYIVKVTASPVVFNMGIKEYMEANSLNNANLKILYYISERVDLGLVISEVYSKDSTSDPAEKLNFQTDIKLEDPIMLE